METVFPRESSERRVERTGAQPAADGPSPTGAVTFPEVFRSVEHGSSIDPDSRPESEARVEPPKAAGPRAQPDAPAASGAPAAERNVPGTEAASRPGGVEGVRTERPKAGGRPVELDLRSIASRNGEAVETTATASESHPAESGADRAASPGPARPAPEHADTPRANETQPIRSGAPRASVRPGPPAAAPPVPGTGGRVPAEGTPAAEPAARFEIGPRADTKVPTHTGPRTDTAPPATHAEPVAPEPRPGEGSAPARNAPAPGLPHPAGKQPVENGHAPVAETSTPDEAASERSAPQPSDARRSPAPPTAPRQAILAPPGPGAGSGRAPEFRTPPADGDGHGERPRRGGAIGALRASGRAPGRTTGASTPSNPPSTVAETPPANRVDATPAPAPGAAEGAVSAPGEARGSSVPTPTPVASTPADPVVVQVAPGLEAQIAVRAREFLERGWTELRVTLDPPSLGKLRVRLELSEGRAVAHIVASSPEAAAVLTREREDLMRAFQQQGFEHVDVHVDSEHESAARSRHGQDGNEDGPRDGSAPSPDGTVRFPRRANLSSTQRVDLFA